LGDDEAEAGDDDVDDEERGEHDERPHEPLEVGVRLPFARCVERLDHSALPRVTIVSTMRSVVMSDSSWRTSMSSRSRRPAIYLGDDEAEAGDDDVDDEERGEHDERPHEPLEVGVRLPFARCVERLDHSALPRVTIVSTMRSVVMSDSSWRTSMSSRSRRTAI